MGSKYSISKIYYQNQFHHLSNIMAIIDLQMKLTITNRRQQQKRWELLELSCRTTLSRISKNANDIMYLVQQLSQTYNLRYDQQIGSICAHVTTHYKNSTLRKPERDLVIVHQLVQKFKLVFISKQQHDSSCFSSFQDLVKYGVKCVKVNLNQELLEQLNKDKRYSMRLLGIVSRLLRSLFLEFMPVSYSAVMIELYLSENQGEKETNQMNNQNSTQSFNISPYKIIFQLFLSLSYHICYNKNIVNLAHYLDLLQRPYMGVVEWPMVIGARNHFDLPSPQEVDEIASN